MYMLALGLSQAASSLIGQQIGKGDVAVAQEYRQVCNHIGLIIFPSSIALLCIFRDSILNLFSPIQSVKDACILVWPIILTEQVADQWSGFTQGIIKALGLQKRATSAMLLIYWLFNLPLCFIFIRFTPYGFIGMWLSMALAVFAITVYFEVLVRTADWDQSCEGSRRRTQGIKEEDDGWVKESCTG